MHSEDMNQFIAARYERFIKRVQQQDANAAAEEFARFCHRLNAGGMKISNRAMAAFCEIWIDLFWQCRRHDMMLKVAEDAQAAFGPDPEWSFAQGEALFNLGRFEEARQVLEPLTTEDLDEPMLYYLLAAMAERRGETEDAGRLFAAAHRLGEDEFAIPLPITEEEAIAAYEQCLVDLPDPIIWHLKEVPVYVDAFPSEELIHSFDPPLDPLLLGLYAGQPPAGQPSPWPDDQPRILLFHKNIAKIAGDQDTLEDELRKTLFHEVGHSLGFSEDQLEEMGLA